jgi:hypothetical protein
MGIDDETERPAEQTAGDANEAVQNSRVDSTADEQVTGDGMTGAPNTGAGVTGNGEPGTEGHSEEWLANARKAGEKIRAMFKS